MVPSLILDFYPFKYRKKKKKEKTEQRVREVKYNKLPQARIEARILQSAGVHLRAKDVNLNSFFL